MISLFKRFFGRDTDTSYQEMLNQLELQRIFGVDMQPWADADGRVEAIVCDCGFYRRDKPPATYICGCKRYLRDGKKKLMCKECSKKILDGRSSYATYVACDDCGNKDV